MTALGKKPVPTARARTRPAAKPRSFPGLAKSVLVLLFGALIAFSYQAIQPPAPKICGSPGGPPVTSTRIKLRDGRHLAYLESGVPKETAKHKIIFVHGFDSCRYDTLPVSQELLKELDVCLISYDRPGYGESDPDPSKTEKSNALDIEELADQLGLGDNFYVVGFSMGGEIVWSCLKHIPHRLAGAALLAPVANFWWRGFPTNLTKQAYEAQPPQDQWAVRVAHYMPWLTYWWNTQKWFPASSVIAHNANILSAPDMKIVMKLAAAGPPPTYKTQIRQQGEYETLHRDMMVGFGRCDYSPLELRNPIPGKGGAVQLWHGAEDRIVPPFMSRHIAQELPWIQYHELPNAGHLFPLADGMGDAVVKSLLQGE